MAAITEVLKMQCRNPHATIHPTTTDLAVKRDWPCGSISVKISVTAFELFRLPSIGSRLRGSLGMLAKILKHNDAAIVVLSDSVLRAAGLRLGDEVDVAASSGSIEIRRRDLEDGQLETLIAGMTPENCHASVDYGVVGREIL